MSGTTLKFIIAIVIFIHGIGHSMGILSAFRQFATEVWHSRSWLLTKLIGEPITRVLCILIWLITTLGFLGTGLALLGWGVPHELWRSLATFSAIVSLVGLFLYWNAFAALLNKVGAIAVNLAIIIGLLIMKWPTEADLGLS